MNDPKTLAELFEISEKHKYYCDDWGRGEIYDNFDDFIEDFNKMDEDLNMVFRWDLETDDENRYILKINMVLQRKAEILTDKVVVYEKDLPKILELLHNKFNY